VAEANRRETGGGTTAVFPVRWAGDATTFDMDFVVPVTAVLDAVRRKGGRGSEGVLVAVLTLLLGVLAPSEFVLGLFCKI
jgi:hypothetical protein